MRRFDRWFVLLALIAATGCIGYLSTRHVWVADWTRGARASLAPESVAVLKKLDGPVDVVGYLSSAGDLREQLAAIVERYTREKGDLTLRFVDPDIDPAASRQLGITGDGALLLRHAGREERVESPVNERSFSNALERLARGGERVVAFVSGDGERQADGKANADLGMFMLQLERRGVRAVPLNFTQVMGVPEHTDLVVLASPSAPLPDGAVRALVDYVRGGGNILWLTEPGEDNLGTGPLADVLGVRVLPGVLVDGQGSALGLQDPRLITLGDYPFHAVTHGFRLTTLFPQVAALAQVSDHDWAVVPFLRSGDRSWTAFHGIDNDKPSTIRFDPAAGELKGPLDFGFALNRLSPRPDRSEQRAMIVGDGDFLSNTFVGNGGNRALGERMFDWLLGDDVLVDLPSRGAPDRVIRLSQDALNMLTLGFLIALPMLLLGAGAFIAWRRRRR
ncbi:ABC transporter family protein [Luteibacter rhizovicinus]|uniref:ABC transporter family protein n=1 Tax=Luteibacter rhizovicinus TaxID=242606 RepID=A0A4R3YUR4_9GAMM|nr:Gldg family protein [Luteibacter rhizovicinus]TCV96212.1 ABC transporter family protein [Luteibacter rhizovicinus]